MSETADAVIVGGGVIGTSIAYYLARKGYGNIVLLERDSLASGSTGRSVATIDFVTLHPEAVELYARSSTFFSHCDELLGAECGFVETGSIIAAGPDKMGVLINAVRLLSDAGVEVESLSLDALARLEPMVSVDGLAAASYAPHAGYADPVLTTQAFAGAAKRLGVQIRQGQTVTGIQHLGNRNYTVETANGVPGDGVPGDGVRADGGHAYHSIESPTVIVAAGAWSTGLLQTIGINLDMQPVRHPVVCLRRPEDFGPAHHSLLDLTTGIYARPEGSDLTLAGSIDPHVGYDPTSPDDILDTVEDDYVFWTMERLVHRYPTLSASEICRGWAGVMTVTPDWQPIIGNWADKPGLYCAAGFSGRGFQISPSVGDLLASLVVGEEKAAAYLEPFSPSRFAAGQTAQSGKINDGCGLMG